MRVLLFRFTILLFLSLVFASCLRLTKDFPEKKAYLIEVESPKKGNIRFQNYVLKMRRVAISNKFEGKGFIYRKSESKYEADFYNEFLVSPQNNLSEEIVRYLAGSNLFGNVSDMNSRMEATHFLEVEFTSLYGDYRNKDNTAALVEVQFRIFDDRKGDYRPIWKKLYSSRTIVKPDSPESLVQGWNKSLGIILSLFVDDLNRIQFEDLD